MSGTCRCKKKIRSIEKGMPMYADMLGSDSLCGGVAGEILGFCSKSTTAAFARKLQERL
jgi:hypothetical protein